MSTDVQSLAFEHPELADLDPAERRLAFRTLAAQTIAPEEVSEAVRRFSQDVDGFGPLSDLMRDGSVTDVLVNGPSEVWVERDGCLERTDVSFEGTSDLVRLVDRLLARSSERVDLSNPMGDARLADGSRIHVVLPPIAPNGPLVSIRRFGPAAWSLGDLAELGMFEPDTTRKLHEWVRARKTIVVSGGTGTGKTTLLNALLVAVPGSERVVTIEETRELRPSCPHAVSLVARDHNQEGQGAVGVSALLRAALRMRPDRIVVGEVRGAEAIVALAAMSTGHAGSLLTIHASSARGALDRMTSLALSAGSSATEDSVRRSVEAAFDVIVHLDRTDGSRRAVEILVL